MREKAIDAAGALGVPTTLAMVLDKRTIVGVGDTLRWAMARPHVRGISLQPMFTSGRVANVESRTLPVFPGAGTGAGTNTRGIVNTMGVSDAVPAPAVVEVVAVPAVSDVAEARSANSVEPSAARDSLLDQLPDTLQV